MVELEASEKFSANVYEKKQPQAGDSKIIEEDNEDWKYIQVLPPPRKEPKKADLIKVTDLPKYCQ